MKLRLAFVVYGGANRVDWRTLEAAQVTTTPEDVRQRLLPLLRTDLIPSPADLVLWTGRLVSESVALLSAVLPLTAGELAFLEQLNGAGEIAPELLTDDARLHAISAHIRASSGRRSTSDGGSPGRRPRRTKNRPSSVELGLSQDLAAPSSLSFGPEGARNSSTAEKARSSGTAPKCRGSEYLRMIYGPEYTLPSNLERLRKRGLSSKRSLALRELALGIEGLERFVHREPLRRVHECVFAILALESEPVDPRL